MNPIRKFFAEQKKKSSAPVVSLASLVRDYKYVLQYIFVYISVSIYHTTRFALYIYWYHYWLGQWCSFATNDSNIWKSSKYFY